MRFFGLEITRKQQLATATLPYDRGYWWWPIIREPFTGAWQRNMEQRAETLATHHAVYACITLIASDVAKCRLRLVQEIEPDVWEEVRDVNSPYVAVMRKPNRYQNRIQFFENWMISKLVNGNAYILKGRDSRGIVDEMTVLDPLRTKPLVAPNGEVYYELGTDNLANVDAKVTVPASEIIHDMATMRFHPLCGIPPIAPAALAASQGLAIQRNSINLFTNEARPGGFLTAPGAINEETAKRLKEQWEENFTGVNRGRTAVLGDGLEWKGMSQTAVDTQTIEQLGITAKMVCSAFSVPPYKVQVGDPPSHNNVGALNTQYYTDCLQKHLEAIELALDEGLGLTVVPGRRYGADFDTDALLRMDAAATIKSMQDGVRGGFVAPDEARRKLNYPAVPEGAGKSPMMQHQDYSLIALAKRDARDDPFAASTPATPKEPATDENADDEDSPDDEENARMIARLELRSLLDLSAIARDIERGL